MPSKPKALTEVTSFDCAAGDGKVKKDDAVFVGDEVYHDECHVRLALTQVVEEQVEATVKAQRAEKKAAQARAKEAASK
jgi:hypothetical protein